MIGKESKTLFDTDFYHGKRVFLTGHTGFKGTWLTFLLKLLGADVCGFALTPPTEPSLYEILGISREIHSVRGDIRDLQSLQKAFESFQPEIVLHLAAQPIVRESYRDPRTTYETNVMGTVNILECIRISKSVKSFLNVTTDKVYQNNEWVWGYRENDPLDGFDPYSNSKSCSDLVTHCYKKSFFSEGIPAISTARAGNVIGGGDFAKDRILPDCIRAVTTGNPIIVRNPFSTRPYQHVLEPLAAYLMIAARQSEDPALAGYYNVGPNDDNCVTTGKLVNIFCECWGEKAYWKDIHDNGPHEANFLKLDCSKLKQTFNWNPIWTVQQAVEKTVEWTKAWINKEDIRTVMSSQIEEYQSEWL